MPVQTLRNGRFRAHLQRRNHVGEKESIHGPRRGTKRKAEEDHDVIQAAAQQGPDAWGAMQAEAHRLQDKAKFEGLVAVRAADSAGATRPILPPASRQSQEDTQSSDEQDYCGDVTELWQEIDDEGRLPASYVHPPLIPMAKEPENEVEATAMLSKFNPTRMDTEHLKKLLDARADPNITLDGNIHPLMNVMAFAPASTVAEMRTLLLQAGATETNEHKERWVSRRRADASEEAWMRNFHRAPTLVPFH